MDLNLVDPERVSARISHAQDQRHASADFAADDRARESKAGNGPAERQKSGRNLFKHISQKIWSHGNAERVDFCSGIGSTEEYTRDYERAIGRFIAENKIGTIVDLGCGDFQVGRRILDIVDCQYIGVDVVADLIERNSRRFASERVSFICKDVSHDELPDGDLCLIRQVLQHLDNKTIARVLENVRKCPFCIVTESQHIHPRTVNLDIQSGAWTRALFGSRLYFDQPPFSRSIKTLLKIHRDAENVIHTCLLMP